MVTLASCKRLVKEWQTRLGLLDWAVETSLETKHDPGYFARSTITGSYRHVILRLRHPSLCPPDSIGINDIELTIVHELIHVKFYPFHRKGGRVSDDQEAAIEHTAQALVNAKRGKLKLHE